MSTSMILPMILGVFGGMVVIYVLVVSRKPVMRKDKRCEEFMKELEKQPLNPTIGEELYSAKVKQNKID